MKTITKAGLGLGAIFGVALAAYGADQIEIERTIKGKITTFDYEDDGCYGLILMGVCEATATIGLGNGETVEVIFSESAFNHPESLSDASNLLSREMGDRAGNNTGKNFLAIYDQSLLERILPNNNTDMAFNADQVFIGLE